MAFRAATVTQASNARNLVSPITCAAEIMKPDVICFRAPLQIKLSYIQREFLDTELL
jgi:hypothetical protein